MVCTSVAQPDSDSMDAFSSWCRLKKVVAWILRYKNKLLRKSSNSGSISVDEFEQAEKAIIRCVQLKSFRDEFDRCSTSGLKLKRDSFQLKLNPFVCEELLRVGGYP